MNFGTTILAVISVLILFLFSNHGVLGDTDATWRKAALDRHNKLRAKHGSPALKQNQELCEKSQKYADKLRDSGTPDTAAKVEHSPEARDKSSTVGENLHYSTWPDGQKIPPEKAVNNWYAEKENYDFKNPGNSKNGKKIRHFTQVVWKGSTEVCVSYASSGVGKSGMAYYYVVANYKDSGNIVGAYAANVMPSKEDRSGSDSGAPSVLKLQKTCIFICLINFLIYAFA